MTGLDQHGGRKASWNRGSRTWLCARGVGDTQKFADERRHLLVVPVGERQHQLFIVEIGIGILWVVDDQWPSESIWILAVHVGMVPICAWLSDLDSGSVLIIAHRLSLELDIR